MNAADTSEKDRPQPISVMVVDDHEIFRHGLEQIIGSQPDMTFVGGAASASEAMGLIAMVEPDVIVLDLSLKGRSGLETMKDIRTRTSKPVFLILTVHDENLFAERALRAGAKGFVMKEEGAGRVVAGIKEVAAGRFFFSASISQKLMASFVGRGAEDNRLPMDRLTDRELEVFELIGRGLSTRQVAGELNLSFKTVEAHRENIKKKLGIQDAQELIRQAVLWVRELGAG